MNIHFSNLVGKTLVSVVKTDDELIFTVDNGSVYKLMHYQQCCESVYIADICGDLSDLVGTPILYASERTNDTVTNDWGGIERWTFYSIHTAKGYVDIRWNGSSNGYYSVGVDFIKVN